MLISQHGAAGHDTAAALRLSQAPDAIFLCSQSTVALYVSQRYFVKLDGSRLRVPHAAFLVLHSTSNIRYQMQHATSSLVSYT